MSKRNTILSIGLLSMFVLSLFPVSALMQENVEFNGNFENGTTLFSDPYHVNSGYVWGKDVYPVPDDTQNVRERICTVEFEERDRRVCEYVTYTEPREKRVCDYVSSGEVVEVEKCEYVVKYEERSRRICAYNWTTGERECNEYTYEYPNRERECRTVNETLDRRQRVCENVIVDVEKRRRECQTITEQIPRETCRYETINRTEILCINPDGTASNVLNLENFQMSSDNGTTWDSIPYIEQKQSLNNVDLLFKVDIPNQCSPDYEIDEAITLLS